MEDVKDIVEVLNKESPLSVLPTSSQFESKKPTES